MNNKIITFAIFTGFLVTLGFGLFVNKTNAQYYSSSSYLNSGDTCPPDFILTTHDGLYGCFKFLNGNGYNNYYNNEYSNSYTHGYNNYYPNYNYSTTSSSSNLILRCLPGHTYSILTGRRCDGYNNNNYYYNNSNLSGGDATIRSFDVRDGNDTDPKEGDNNAEVMEIRFDVEDGDIRLDRVEFNFELTGNSHGEDLPWNIFDEIRLLSDGREIDSMSADNNNDWNKESNDTYNITFSNLDEIIRENDRANLTLEVDINSNISGANNDDVSWDIFVPDRGLRARDGNGDTIYSGDNRENVSIDIREN